DKNLELIEVKKLLVMPDCAIRGEKLPHLTGQLVARDGDSLHSEDLGSGALSQHPELQFDIAQSLSTRHLMDLADVANRILRPGPGPIGDSSFVVRVQPVSTVHLETVNNSAWRQIDLDDPIAVRRFR